MPIGVNAATAVQFDVLKVDLDRRLIPESVIWIVALGVRDNLVLTTRALTSRSSRASCERSGSGAPDRGQSALSSGYGIDQFAGSATGCASIWIPEASALLTMARDYVSSGLLIKLTRLLIMLMSLSLPVAAVMGQPREWIDPTEIQQDKVLYYRYARTEAGEVDLRDLDLGPGVIGRDLNKVFFSPSQIRTELLSRGWASLKDHTGVSEGELTAEAEARAEGRGLWRQEWLRNRQQELQAQSAQEKESEEGFVELVSTIWLIARDWMLLLGSLGVLVPLAVFVYRRLVYRKRVHLLLVGDGSAGKTALFLRLHDADISRDDLKNLKTTEAVKKYKDRPLAMGKYEVHPVLFDHPGIKPSTQIDGVIVSRWSRALPRARKVVVVFVVAPTQPFDFSSEEHDLSYRLRQVGLLSVLADIYAMSNHVKKPDAMVLFLNKFDLFSKVPPGDSAAQAAKDRFLCLFREHSEAVKARADSANIKYKSIVGSTLETWGIEQVRKTVEAVLYGR